MDKLELMLEADKRGILPPEKKALLDEGDATVEDTGRTYTFLEVGGRLIHADHVDAGIDADLLIFLSRHASVKPLPLLTVHVTGNLRDAELGGSPRSGRYAGLSPLPTGDAA